MTSLPERAGRRCHNAVNPLHSTLYFGKHLSSQLAPYGLEDHSACYLAVRAAPLGAVTAGTVTATFYNFNHTLIAQLVPEIWEHASPDTILAARLRAVDATLRELLGEDGVAAPEVAEAAKLALRATEGCTRPGRPLYAGNADLPVPEPPHLALWHAATLLREHRGDIHIALLQQFNLDPLEALATHTATGKGMAPRWVLSTRGYSEKDWTRAQDRLRERELLDEAGELTLAGEALRRELEEETDRLDAGPYTHLGAEGVARLTELGRQLSGVALQAGAFPDGLFGKG